MLFHKLRFWNSLSIGRFKNDIPHFWTSLTFDTSKIAMWGRYKVVKLFHFIYWPVLIVLNTCIQIGLENLGTELSFSSDSSERFGSSGASNLSSSGSGSVLFSRRFSLLSVLQGLESTSSGSFFSVLFFLKHIHGGLIVLFDYFTTIQMSGGQNFWNLFWQN